ncbi:hypothetical protein ACHAXA_001121 [Cyclostephanos tholiformis]|uniref:Uncharacterized protein n=1 Tax=Cyclostephanos tholiformis TaxID=382380 RepID=A0ABD3R712_9STRA
MDSDYVGFKYLFLPIAIVPSVAYLLTLLRHGTDARALHFGRARWFPPLIVAVSIVYQLHSLNEAYITRRRGGPYRLDCLRSRKGGKRPFGDAGEDYRHPCYDLTGESRNVLVDGTYESNREAYEESTLCQASGEAIIDTSPSYVSSARDCDMGQSNRCTLAEPCVPCEIERRREFQRRWSRCQACSVRNDYGRCNFVDGVGPYCYANGDGTDVVPCRKCCTEKMAIYDEDGYCY